MSKLEEMLGYRYADFEVLNSVEKTSYVLRSELWEQNFYVQEYRNKRCIKRSIRFSH